jgi:type VI secretion system secreted protein VgrG
MFYYRNRYYSPATGRFISEDPIGYASGQTNAYAYVNGNPVSLVDPLGLQRGPVVLGLGDLYRRDVMPPWPQQSRNNAAGDALGDISNFPWPSDRLPGDWVGVNVPWAMPDTYCAAGYYGDPVSSDLTDNSGGSCKTQPPAYPGSYSRPGQSGSRFTCTKVGFR